MVRHVRSWHTVLCTRANGGIRHLALASFIIKGDLTPGRAVREPFPSPFHSPFPFLTLVPHSLRRLLNPSRLHPSNPPFSVSFPAFFPFRYYSFPSSHDFLCLTGEGRAKETIKIGGIGIHFPSLPTFSGPSPSLRCFPSSPSLILNPPPSPLRTNFSFRRHLAY